MYWVTRASGENLKPGHENGSGENLKPYLSLMYGNSRLGRLVSYLLKTSSDNNREIVISLELLDQHRVHALVVRSRVRHSDSLHIKVRGQPEPICEQHRLCENDDQ